MRVRAQPSTLPCSWACGTQQYTPASPFPNILALASCGFTLTGLSRQPSLTYFLFSTVAILLVLTILQGFVPVHDAAALLWKSIGAAHQNKMLPKLDGGLRWRPPLLKILTEIFAIPC